MVAPALLRFLFFVVRVLLVVVLRLVVFEIVVFIRLADDILVSAVAQIERNAFTFRAAGGVGAFDWNVAVVLLAMLRPPASAMPLMWGPASAGPGRLKVDPHIRDDGNPPAALWLPDDARW